MAKCSCCGSLLIFRGIRDGKMRFCNDQCRQKSFLLSVAEKIPRDVIYQQIRQLHKGKCPRCKKEGPVDIHTSHKVWSAIFVTSWKSQPQIVCRSCGIKSQAGSAASSLLLGWWGLPWGIIVTPVQVVRNIMGIIISPDPSRPSARLEEFVTLNLAADLVEQHQKNQQ